MPALPAVPQVIEMKLGFETNGEAEFGCRSFWQFSGATPSATTLETFCQAASTQFMDQFASTISQATQLRQIVMTDLSSSTAARGEWNGAIGGTDTNIGLPPSCVAVLNFGISRRYRGGKPKMFLPCGTTADLLQRNTWTPAFTSGLAGYWSNFNTQVCIFEADGTSIKQQVNVSWYSGFKTVTNPITGRTRNVPQLRGQPVVDRIDSWSVRSYVGAQRRRNTLKA